MRRSSAFRAITLATLLVFTTSCLSTQLPPVSTSGAEFQPLRDEQALWEKAREEEEKLLENVTIYDDPLLVDYLEEVVNRINPPGMAANDALRYRVRVIEDPTLNAFAYPHGAMYVHTGLLARMENEDQLATVLGHEMTHVEHRHMLRYQRAATNKQIGLSIAAVAAAVVIAGAEADAYEAGDWARGARIGVLGDVLVGLGLQLAFLASVNGYGRNLEYEADEGAFHKLVAAGYDVRESPKVYQALLEGHGEPTKLEGFFFGSHPQLTQRIKNAEQFAASQTVRASLSPFEGDSPRSEAFARRIRPVIRDDARLNIENGRLKLAESQLERVIQEMPEDPESHLLMGRLQLAKAEAAKDPAVQADHRERAEESLREAVRLDSERPATRRELGLLLYRDGAFGEACEQFREYVKLAPEADDTPRIRDYILEMERDGDCR
jgi:predicted Zn-dependent protease